MRLRALTFALALFSVSLGSARSDAAEASPAAEAKSPAPVAPADKAAPAEPAKSSAPAGTAGGDKGAGAGQARPPAAGLPDKGAAAPAAIAKAAAAALSGALARLPDSLRGLAKLKVLRLDRIWGGYELRSAGQMVAVSEDGKRLLSGGAGEALRLFEVDSGKQLRVLEGMEAQATCLAFSRVGRHVAAGGRDGSISVWDGESGRLLQTLRRHRGSVTAVAFSGDGKLLASGGEDGVVRVWEVARGRSTYTLYGHQGWVRALAGFSDGRRMASGGQDGTLRVWDLVRGKSLQMLGVPGGPEIVGLAISPDGRFALAGEEGRRVVRWDLKTGILQPLVDQPMKLLALHYSPDGVKFQATGSSKPVVYRATSRGETPAAEIWIREWDASTLDELAASGKPDEGARSAAFFPDGGRALFDENGTLRVWDLSQGRLLRESEGHAGAVEALAVSPDGRLALSAARDSTARLWQLEKAEELYTFADYALDVRAVAFSPDGKLALAADINGLQRLWDVATGQPVKTLGSHRGLATVSFSGDGKLALSSSYERIALWDLETARELGSIWFSRLVAAVAFTADGKLALTAGGGEVPVVREVSTGRTVQSFRWDGREVYAIALSGDGATAILAVRSARGTAVELWDAVAGKPTATLGEVAGRALALSPSADGKQLAGAFSDGSVRLWSLPKRKELERLSLAPNAERATALAFSPDGRTLLVGTSLGAVLEFALAPAE